jgi:lipopolysaccharide export system protein LptA
MRAWAGRAVYEGAGEWLHLTLSPRVDDGGLQLTADKIDVSRESGDAYAHGDVKATWIDEGTAKSGSDQISQAGKPASGAAGQGSLALGGKGPAHVIAAEAQLHQPTGEATFRGHARLWQEANSVAGPVIVLNRQRQTLVASSTDPGEPVRAVLLSASGLDGGSASGKEAHEASGKETIDASGSHANGKPATPSVIRLHGGDLKYSDLDRKAVMRGGALGPVVAESSTAASTSNEVDLFLLPAGTRAVKDGATAQAGAQVDRMVASGRVALSSQGRHGTGEQLVYTSENGEYVLTGTAAAPPRMTDPARGTVTGEALIFNSRDDSVSVEGGGRKTTTDTRTQR